MSPSRLPVWWPWMLLLALAACRPLLQVSLLSGQEQLPSPRFQVSDPEHPERPRYDTVRLVDRSGTLFWHLRAEPFGDSHSVPSLVYGTAPEGFVAVDGPRPLQPGGRYVLSVNGLNQGALYFDVDAEGHAHAAEP